MIRGHVAKPYMIRYKLRDNTSLTAMIRGEMMGEHSYKECCVKASKHHPLSKHKNKSVSQLPSLNLARKAPLLQSCGDNQWLPFPVFAPTAYHVIHVSNSPTP